MQVIRFGDFISQLRHIVVMFAVMLLLLQQAATFDVHRRFIINPASNEDFASAKRNWNNVAVGLWGKRLTGPMFLEDDRRLVKRPQDSWTKLNSLWGKRSSWQTANGLWGKRSGPPSKRFDTGLGEYKRFDAGVIGQLLTICFIFTLLQGVIHEGVFHCPGVDRIVGSF